jgi:hypothetical protein
MRRVKAIQTDYLGAQTRSLIQGCAACCAETGDEDV